MSGSEVYATRVRGVMDHLRAVRRGRRIPMVAVARAMGVGQPYISKLEHSSSDPRLSTVLRYADVVGLSLALVEVAHVA